MNRHREAGRSLMLLLLDAAGRLQERLEESLEQVGLSTARYGVLEQLASAAEPLPLGELANRLGCVRSNMTQLVDRLEAEGLVRRLTDPNDRRCVRAEITAAGRERQGAGEERLAAVRARFDASLSGADRAALARALGSLP